MIKCEFNTCKYNTNRGIEFKDIKKKGKCTCPEDIMLECFCINGVQETDYDGDIPRGSFDKNLNMAEGLFCNKYEFYKEVEINE